MQQAIKMNIEHDSKAEIVEAAGINLKDLPLTGAQILVGIYKRPEKTKGGLILTDNYRQEDIWQGKVGLILKMGPIPFDDKDKEFFGDVSPKEGDWVVFRPSDGWPLSIGSQPCRMLDDRRRVKMILPAPDLVF